MPDGPDDFGVVVRVEVGIRLIQQFTGLKAVKTHEPVGLIQPVFPQHGRLSDLWQPGIFIDRHIGRKIDPLHGKFLIQRR